MSKNILFIIGSPAGKKGNSESIADYLKERLSEKNLPSDKIFLRKDTAELTNSIEYLDKADIIVLSLPVYENSVPGLIVRFFEVMVQNKANLTKKARKFLAITNSGFPETAANRGAIANCRLFARDMGFKWLGGIGIAPGTLIDGKKLDQTGNTYKKVITLLDIIVAKVASGEEIPEKAFDLVSKPFIMPLLYRFVGRMLQKGVIKRVGKDRYYAKPLGS